MFKCFRVQCSVKRRMRFEMDKSSQHSTNAHQHILSAAEGGLPNMTSHARFLNAKSETNVERDCRVSLEERDLWTKFQELTNEMIVTKNGRLVLAFHYQQSKQARR